MKNKLKNLKSLINLSIKKCIFCIMKMIFINVIEMTFKRCYKNEINKKNFFVL